MTVRILTGDCIAHLRALPECFRVQTCVTSPPYFGLRDYGHAGQIGLEPTPDEYVAKLVQVFREVRRVLRDDGTLWLNLGDSYATGAGKVGECPGGGKQGEDWKRKGAMTPANRLPLPGLKPKDLIGIPWRVAFALQADGWYLRSDIIWHKPNPMPESVTDRPTKAHEHLFLLAKSDRYHYDAAAIAEKSVTGDDRRPYAPGQVDSRGNGHDRGGGQQRGPVAQHKQKALGRAIESGTLGSNDPFATRNRRTVWTVATQSYSGAHFATFPPALIEPCILAGCPEGGTVLDPFGGAGTTGLVADRLQRHALLIELNPEYAQLARNRIHGDAPLLSDIT